MKKKILKTIISVLALALAFNLFTGCELSNDTNDDIALANTTYVSISINPLVEFVVNEDDIVTAVNCANEDAEILLSDVNLVGLTVEEATETFVNLATEAGYIDENSEDNQVTITVVTEDEDTEDGLQNRIKNRINNFFNKKGITGRVTEKEILEQYGEEIDALDISLGKKMMIVRLLELDDSLDINTLKDMTEKELIELFRQNTSNGLDSTIRDEFKDERDALREEFLAEKESMYQAAKDEIDTEYADMFTLETEIAVIEDSLLNFEGTEEERTALESELATKTAAYDVLQADYDAAMEQATNDYENMTGDYEALKAQFGDQLKEIIDSFKAQRQELKQEQKQYKQQIMEQKRQQKQLLIEQQQQQNEQLQQQQQGQREQMRQQQEQERQQLIEQQQQQRDQLRQQQKGQRDEFLQQQREQLREQIEEWKNNYNNNMPQM